MKTVTAFVALSLACLAGCDSMSTTGADPGSTCTISAAVTPATANADHSLAAPGNQVLFTASSTVTGNCPLTPDTLGSWTSSDPADAALTTNPQSPLQAVATCRNATPAPATISYSGTVRGRPFTAATVTCR